MRIKLITISLWLNMLLINAQTNYYAGDNLAYSQRFAMV